MRACPNSNATEVTEGQEKARARHRGASEIAIAVAHISKKQHGTRASQH